MRHSSSITAVLMILIGLGLAACGGSGPSGFTARGVPPANPADWTWGHPSAEMTDEAEALIVDKYGGSYASPRCVPAKSLDGTGEYNFDCTAEDRRRGGRFKVDAVVFGSESGEPVLGPVGEYLCDPVDAQGRDLPRPC